MSHEERVFGETPFEYEKIITCIFIGGLTDSEIAAKVQNDTAFPVMKCLFCFPQSEINSIDQVPFKFLYPNEQYELSAPKFFSMTFTNEKGIRSFVYCFKLSELFHGDNKVKTFLPLIIGIKSYKTDIYAFKDLFEKIYQIIYEEDPNGHYANYLSDEVFNCKKVELLNLFAFCTELIKPSPHTNIRLKFGTKTKDKMTQNIMKHIDFYYSSNCEIPCNKNDSDINVLFAVLDLEIIIKLVISILSERQIIIIASDAPLLFNIFPALLKLIFPFKWIHAYLPLLPNDQFEILQAPVSYLIGLLSYYKDNTEIQELLETNDTRVIVDCDSNEIFGYVEYPFYFFRPRDDKNTSERLLYMDKSDIYGYDLNKKTKTHYEFPETMSKLIIDCENNKMLYARQKNEDLDEDWASLRQKLQLAKNPCIFNLDDFTFCQKKSEIKIGDIKINRPFSYNVQSIFLHFYHLKIKKYYEEIDDMLINTIKHTNLFEDFTQLAIYENDAGGVLFKNIFEVKEERSLQNSFKIEYVFPLFPVKKVLNEFKKESIIIPEKINKILNDYFKVKENNNSDKKVIFPFGKNEKKAHKKNTKSLLQKSHEMNTKHFNQLGQDGNNQGECAFNFYGKNGFLAFVNEFFVLFAKSSLSFINLCYESQILSDIVFSVKKELVEIRMTEIRNEEIKQSEPKQEDEKNKGNQLNPIQEEEEENGSITLESFRYTKNNCSTGMNIALEDDSTDAMLNYNDEPTKVQYYLFLAYTLEAIPDKMFIIDKYNLDTNINSIILQLYIKAYSIDQKEYPLFKFKLFVEKYLNSIDSIITNPIPIIHKDLYEITLKSIKKIQETKAKLISTNQLSIMNKTHSIIDKTNIPFDISPEINNCTFTDGNTIIENKITSSSIGNKTEQYSQKIIINNKIDFDSQLKPMSYNIINQMGEMISAYLLSIDNSQIHSPYSLINLLSEEISNGVIQELVGELAEIDLSSIYHTGDKIAFWLNCYNYLLLFTLFYKKWIINKDSDWKLFFKNIHYIIGKREVSFIDMQYIILGKVLFFEGTLKPSESIKELCIVKIDNWRLLGLLFYSPTGITLSPKVYKAIDFEEGQMVIDNFNAYLKNFLKLETKQKIIHIPELLTFIDINWIEKLKKVIPDNISIALKGRAKKKIVNATWLMDFSFLV